MPGLRDIRPSAAPAPVDVERIDHALAVDRLPEYAEMMAAFHRAFAPELRSMVADVWPACSRRLLDLACGDGCYSVWMAEQAGAEGSVVSVDVSRNWLDVARQTARRGAADGQQMTVAADALRLPFADGCFDFAWCAQSLYSVRDPGRLLREVYRVLCPGGRIALLENDSLHQLLLPWHPALELRLRAAEWSVAQRRSDQPERIYLGRTLRRRLCDAGFTACHKRTYASNREGPFTGDLRTYLVEYLRALSESAQPDASPADLAMLERLIISGENECFLDDQTITITSIDHVVWGDKP